MEKLNPGGTLVALDRDTEAIAAASRRLSLLDYAVSFLPIHTGFGEMESALTATDRTRGLQFDGALFDLGVSSHQLDTARGFSFRRDEPLTMRMDAGARSGKTAADLLAESSEAEIARILWEYGEERWAKRIAQRIVERRRQGEALTTTGQLASLIESSIPRAAWPKDIHVATRSFQALRIAVNEELGQLKAGLAAALERLKPNGRLVVISYHSLEDRIVKQMFARWSGRIPSAPGFSPAAFLPSEPTTAKAALLTRKSVVPTEEEIARNPRARSARLRALQRIA
jgi:16S rRNA (cytosine1402-N4)-methyltransferase